MSSQGGLTRDHVIWAYRLLLDREPEDEQVIRKKLHGLSSVKDLRAELVSSAEYRDKNPDFAQTNDRNLVIKDLGGVRLVVDLSDHAIGLNIIRGRYEQNELAFVKSVVRPGDHAIDCGAHIGLFTMHMASWVGPGGSVTAFEPFPDNAACLTQSIRENHFEDRVVFEQAAVGERDDVLKLLFAAETRNKGGAFLQTATTEVPPRHEALPVRVIGLDSYPLRRPVRFMKLDVEGAEPYVVLGAGRIIQEDRPIILSELHRDQILTVCNIGADVYVAQLIAYGYKCFSLAADGRPGEELRDLPDADVTSVAFLPQ
jgi:FkbM family methyltransferase